MRDDTSRPALSGPENMERILVGACVGIWLVALGAGVAATVALVDLGSGRGSVRAELSGSDTPWVLYTVIGVSAAVIAAAIPLLIRARRDTSLRPARGTGSTGSTGVTGADVLPKRSAERRVLAPTPDSDGRPPALPAVVEQVYVRFAAVIGCAVGAGVLAVGIGTYLMATGSGTAAWVAYGVAGLVTVAMPAAAWFYLRELRAVTA